MLFVPVLIPATDRGLVLVNIDSSSQIEGGVAPGRGHGRGSSHLRRQSARHVCR